MLEKQDYQEIARLMKVIVESDITPQLKAIAEGQQVLLETLAQKAGLKSLRRRSRFSSPFSSCTVRSSPG